MIASAAARHIFSTIVRFQPLPLIRQIVNELDAALDFSYIRYRIKHERSEIKAWLKERPSGALSKVSVITPTYDIALPYLKEFVSGVTRQTHRNWELCFCIDGTQPPGVALWLEALARKDSRIKLISHQTNRGICAATRSALALASGEIIVFCDADDLLHRRALECLAVSFAEEETVDFVYSDLDMCTDYGLRIAPHRKPDWSPDLLASANYINHVVAVRKQLVDSLTIDSLFPDGVSGAQDWHFCFLATRLARRVRHVPFPLYHWRSRPGSIAADPHAKPYTHDAALRVLGSEYSHRHPDLEAIFDPEVQIFRPSIKVDARRSVEVLHVNIGAGALRATMGQEAAARDLLENIDARIRSAVASSTSKSKLVFVNVQVAGKDVSEVTRELDAPLTTGFKGTSLEPLAAFALQRGVAGVWPFLASGSRSGYTIGSPEGLVPWGPSFTPFALNVSNVLTGPLHGCLIAADKLFSLGGLSRIASRSCILDSCTTDRLGAALGFEALRQGFRNVSAPGVTSKRVPDFVTFTHGLNYDPFLF